MIVINGNDDSIYKKNMNKVIISEAENNSIDQNYTLLQTNFTSVEDFIKAQKIIEKQASPINEICLLYTSPSPRDATLSRMPSSA